MNRFAKSFFLQSKWCSHLSQLWQQANDKHDIFNAQKYSNSTDTIIRLCACENTNVCILYPNKIRDATLPSANDAIPVVCFKSKINSNRWTTIASSVCWALSIAYNYDVIPAFQSVRLPEFSQMRRLSKAQFNSQTPTQIFQKLFNLKFSHYCERLFEVLPEFPIKTVIWY